MRNIKNRLSAKRRQPFLKIIGAAFLMLAIIITQIPVPAVEAASSDFRLDGTKLVKYTGKDSGVTIPNTVTSISSEAFADNTTLSSVTIPDSVTKIEMGAFGGCTSLKAITIPDNVTEIGKSAFSGCTSVTGLSIGSGLGTLGASAFGGCTSLQTATISENNRNFYCKDGVIYDRGQTTVYQMLAGRKGDSYTMPSTVTKINEYAFWGCGNLKKVSLSNNLTEIPAYAFSNCTGLESVDVPYSVKSIQMKAFENCEKLSNIEIPQSVSFIHETAFDGCPMVQDKIKTTPLVTDTSTGTNSESTDTVSNDPASDTVPSSDRTQTNKTVSEDNVEVNSEVTDAGTEEASTEESTTEESTTEENAAETQEKDRNTTEAVPQQQIDGMETKENADVIGKTKIIGGQALVLIDSKSANVIVDGVPSKKIKNENDTSADGTSLVKGSYYRNADLHSYNIENRITKIEDFAFARSGLRNITIPDNVAEIGYAAFYHCDQLEHVTIPDSVTSIKGEAFNKTPWMEHWLSGEKTEDSTADIQDTANEKDSDFLVVGDGILINYKGTDSKVTIPEGVKQIASGTFKNHTEVQDITFPDSLVKICDNAFDGCSNLKSFDGGANLSTMEENAFANCPIELTTEVSTTTVQSAKQNYIGNVGTYALLKKTETKDPVYQGLKYGTIAVCTLAGILLISMTLIRKKEQ
ncbi:MAG: leucine-rich repeat domain-containing protein [Lachnospiraceae bacterium]|nr:leucine-rich repeat domain-containing protein [Lachnospiraceae bacterium]